MFEIILFCRGFYVKHSVSSQITWNVHLSLYFTGQPMGNLGAIFGIFLKQKVISSFINQIGSVKSMVKGGINTIQGLQEITFSFLSPMVKRLI